MAQIHVYTSAAANYLPKVAALFASIVEQHPEWQCHLLLVEDMDDSALGALALPWPTVQVRDLDIPSWRPWAFCHSIVELCTAVKPFMLQRLLARDDCDGVLYFDPDILLFSRLDDVLAALQSASILLTPHQTHPEQSLEAVIGNEITSLRYGSYNLGFVAVANDVNGRAFADWWAERLYRFCRDDPARGLFTDQRWIDLVPSLFDGVQILRSPRLNVAAWNWTTRSLSVAEKGEVRCAGEPLGFYHFTGIDSGNHELMLAKFPSHGAAVSHLLAHYRESLAVQERHHGELAGDLPWTLGVLEDGTAVQGWWRQRYRDEPELQSRFSNPWAPAFAAWAESAGQSHTAADQYMSAGYQGGQPGLDMVKALTHLRTALLRPELGLKMLAHANKIVRNEGVAGIRRRLSRSASADREQ